MRGCGWGEGGGRVRMGADGVCGARDGRVRMCGEAGGARGRGARGVGWKDADVRRGRRGARTGCEGAGANRKAREAGRGVWEAATRGEGGRREKNGHIAQEICGDADGVCGARDGRARMCGEAGGARGRGARERVRIGRRAKRGAGFGRPRRGGKGDEKWAYSPGDMRGADGVCGAWDGGARGKQDTGGHLRTHVRIW